MGTSALILVKDEEETLVSIYVQCDGYVEGVGHKLAKHIGHHTIINGIGGEDSSDAANGMGCLAAQIVAGLKDGIGHIYLQHLDHANYTYTITENEEHRLNVAILEGDEEIYNGLLSELRG